MVPFLASQRTFGSLRWIGPTIALGAWVVVGETHLVSPLLLPPPHAIFVKAIELRELLLWHIAATYGRIVVCFCSGLLLGLGVGMMMQYSARAYVLLDSLIESWRPVPVIALIPFTILLFGFSEAGKIVIGSLGVALIIVVAVVEAIARTPRPILLLGVTARLARWEIFSSLIMPHLVPQLKAGARVALAVAATLVIAAEFMGATYGLGYLINTARVTLSTATIFLCILILGAVSGILDMLLRRVFGRLGWWEVTTVTSTEV
jgi:ABC-type nitrate/sulfonate/bicarbonate transport system permease component